MEIFLLALQQLMMMVFLMVVGYLLRKKNIVPENSGIVVSKLETFVFVPALSLINQLNHCTVETFTKNSFYILYGFIFIMMAVVIGCLLSRVFVRNCNSPDQEYQRNVYKYALTFSNYGFVGNFIILGIWGDEMLYKYTMFAFVIGIICSSWGLYILIPKNEGSLIANLKKGLTAPPMIALFVGMIGGLFGLKQYVPSFAMSALDNASKCMGPCAMLLAGIVIGGYNIKGLLSNKKVYIVTFLRLIAIPAVFLLVLNALGASDEIMILAMVAFASPIGLNTIVYPAAYGGDTKTGASMTVISSVLSIITIPIMYYIFIVLI